MFLICHLAAPLSVCIEIVLLRCNDRAFSFKQMSLSTGQCTACVNTQARPTLSLLSPPSFSFPTSFCPPT